MLDPNLARGRSGIIGIIGIIGRFWHIFGLLLL
jgi:hypothetical protein